MMYYFIKRFIDIVLSLVGIIIMILPWIIISLIISFSSPGPIIYKAKRVGLLGNIFICLKFRTMIVDSGDVKTTTLRNDERIYKFGAFLRKTKLDETPQLINILFGQMTIIGPRPEDVANCARYYVGKYNSILCAKPGLSSPASLYDYTHGELFQNIKEYEEVFMPQKLDLELYYVNNRGLWYDVMIFFRTAIIIIAIVFGKKRFKTPREFKKIKEEYEKV